MEIDSHYTKGDMTTTCDVVQDMWTTAMAAAAAKMAKTEFLPETSSTTVVEHVLKRITFFFFFVKSPQQRPIGHYSYATSTAYNGYGFK